VVLVAVASVWLASGTQREKPVLTEEQAVQVRALEGEVAQNPADAAVVRRLGQAYLDAHAPGLALVAIESAPTTVRREPLVEHLYARALLDQGRAQDALAAEERVLHKCAPGLDGTSPCDTWLLASATRRADILRELAILGVEDASAHPEASAVAYHNATREVRLAVR
jgi:cytochrome c-type biogenesis protein CcmH/NrfG